MSGSADAGRCSSCLEPARSAGADRLQRPDEKQRPLAGDENEGDGTRAWSDFRDQHELGLAKLYVRLTNDCQGRPLYSEIEKIEHRNLAVADYHIQFRTEAQMMAQIEKYTRSNLEHRRWLITQLSDTKLKDLYPGYKLK